MQKMRHSQPYSSFISHSVLFLSCPQSAGWPHHIVSHYKCFKLSFFTALYARYTKGLPNLFRPLEWSTYSEMLIAQSTAGEALKEYGK